MEKKKKFSKLVILFVEMIALLVVGVFAWIEGTSTPSVVGPNMLLASSPGLIMKVDGAYTTQIDLNKYCSDATDKTLILAEATATETEKGLRMFFRNVSDQAISDKESIYVREATLSDRNTNYIYLTFTLTADQNTQDVWIDGSPNTSHVTMPAKSSEPLEAVRLYFEIQKTDSKGNLDEDFEPITYILSDFTDEQDKDHTKYGYFDFDRSKDALSAEYKKEVDVLDLKSFDSGSPMFTIQKGDTYRVLMCVYLEGSDAQCIDNISGENVDLKLYFKCATNKTAQETS